MESWAPDNWYGYVPAFGVQPSTLFHWMCLVSEHLLCAWLWARCLKAASLLCAPPCILMSIIAFTPWYNAGCVFCLPPWAVSTSWAEWSFTQSLAHSRLSN